MIKCYVFEVALLSPSLTNVALYDPAKSNNAVVTFTADPLNEQLNPYADHEYLPVCKSGKQRKNKVPVDPLWLTDGLKSGNENVVQWSAPAKTGDGDKEAGTAIQGEVIVQFKFTSPVEIQNVTVYSTSSSHSWNGSVLMAYSDGLWRPLIKTFAVVIDDTLNPHDMNDPPVA